LTTYTTVSTRYQLDISRPAGSALAVDLFRDGLRPVLNGSQLPIESSVRFTDPGVRCYRLACSILSRRAAARRIRTRTWTAWTSSLVGS
jgi:hypothetical protein